MESPYKEIVEGIVGGSVLASLMGTIKAIVEVYKILAERIEVKRKEKKAVAEQHLSQNIEMRRLDRETENVSYERLCSLLEKSEKEEERLRGELEKVQATSELTDGEIMKIYQAFRALGKAIDTVDWIIAKKDGCADLTEPLENLKKKYDELGERLPA